VGRSWFLSKKFYQTIDVTIIGCKNKNLLHRYDSDFEICNACEFVIEMIDGGLGNVFKRPSIHSNPYEDAAQPNLTGGTPKRGAPGLLEHWDY